MKRFRCDWCNWTMGVDPSLATPMPYSLCSTSHSILQWHCFLDTHVHLKNSRCFSFQILVLSYELFTSLAFFSHYPGDNQSHKVYLQLSDETIILRLQSLLDLFTSCVRPPWTLLGLPHLRKRGMGILNTRQGEVCMVAPPLLDVQSSFYFY